MSGRLHVDRTACRGRGMCHELLPELLAPDDWGYPLVRTGGNDAAVPPSLEPLARRAVDDCPVLALRLLQG